MFFVDVFFSGMRVDKSIPYLWGLPHPQYIKVQWKNLAIIAGVQGSSTSLCFNLYYVGLDGGNTPQGILLMQAWVIL